LNKKILKEEKMENFAKNNHEPKEVVRKDYPKCNYINSEIDDTMKAIDETKNSSVSKIKRNSSYQKG